MPSPGKRTQNIDIGHGTCVISPEEIDVGKVDEDKEHEQ